MAYTGGRSFKSISSSVEFWFGAVVGGMLTYGAIGLVFPSGIQRAVNDPVTVYLLAASFLWHIRGRPTFRGAKAEIQANRQWATSRRFGRVYFGVLLGAGLLTAMTTPLVFAGAGLAAVNGPGWGVAYGAGFGTGRSIPTFAAVFASATGSDVSPASVTDRLVIRGGRLARRLGSCTASGALFVWLIGKFR